MYKQKTKIFDIQEGIEINKDKKASSLFYKKMIIEYESDKTIAKNKVPFPNLEEFMDLDNSLREYLFKVLYSLLETRRVKSKFDIPQPLIFALASINNNFKLITKEGSIEPSKHISKNLSEWDTLLLTHEHNPKEFKKFDEVLLLNTKNTLKDINKILKSIDFNDSKQLINIYLECNALNTFLIAKALRKENKEFKLWMKHNRDWDRKSVV